MIHMAKKRPVTSTHVILKSVEGICDAVDSINDSKRGYYVFSYNQESFDEVFCFLAKRIGADRTTYEATLYNMMVVGKHIWVYDSTLNRSTRLTIHKLDVALQKYTDGNPNFDYWRDDNYDALLQVALYGDIIHDCAFTGRAPRKEPYE